MKLTLLVLFCIISVSECYFEFIPEYKISLYPNSDINIKTNCGIIHIYRENYIISTYNYNSSPILNRCQNHYLFADWYDYRIENLEYSNSIKWNNNNSTIYIFQFLNSYFKNIKDIWDTVYLFLNYIKLPLTRSIQTANRDFLQKYTNQNLNYRNGTIPYKFNKDIPDYNLLPNGTILAILRLDGLLTMEAYGMGSGTGHIAIIIWDNNIPYVYESNDKTIYWPDKGIQRHTWSEWLILAQKANFLVSILPLDNKYSSMISESKHLTYWLESVIGLPYGYHNYLFGWIDTAEDNFPLTLSSYFFEIIFSLIDRKDPNISNKMWNQALSKRLNLNSNITRNTVEIYEYAKIKNTNFTKLITIPENDTWVYNDGISMVCNVFVCRVFKESGIFGDISSLIQCSEFQNWDTYSLNLFNETVPVFCKSQDNLPFCQIMGEYRMFLPGYNTKKIYPHMAEKCPSLPPNYIRPKYC